MKNALTVVRSVAISTSISLVALCGFGLAAYSEVECVEALNSEVAVSKCVDADGNAESIYVDAEGNTEVTTVDSEGNELTVTEDSEGTTEVTAVDSDGNQLTVTEDSEGNRTTELIEVAK